MLRSSTTAKKGRWRWLCRALAIAGLFPLLYLLAALLGLIPVNTDFRSAQTGVDIYVVSNGVHTDIIVPTRTETMDWRELFPAADFAARRDLPHMQFGWGDRQFYVETPTWADIRLTTLLRSSLLPTSATMHVAYVPQPVASPECRRLRLSREQYERLVGQLRKTLVLDADRLPIRIAVPGYHAYDGFYEAHGTYHLLNTCNCWTGRTLRSAGVRTGIWTPFPASVMSTLPASEAA